MTKIEQSLHLHLGHPFSQLLLTFSWRDTTIQPGIIIIVQQLPSICCNNSIVFLSDCTCDCRSLSVQHNTSHFYMYLGLRNTNLFSGVNLVSLLPSVVLYTCLNFHTLPDMWPKCLCTSAMRCAVVYWSGNEKHN